jgi:hypothetical protein
VKGDKGDKGDKGTKVRDSIAGIPALCGHASD